MESCNDTGSAFLFSMPFVPTCVAVDSTRGYVFVGNGTVMRKYSLLDYRKTKWPLRHNLSTFVVNEATGQLVGTGWFYDGKRMQRFSDERLVETFSNIPSRRPFAFAVYDGGGAVTAAELIVVHRDDHCVMAYSMDDMHYLRRVGGVMLRGGSRDGELSSPSSVAVGNDCAFVADTDNRRVSVFRIADGAFVRHIGDDDGGGGRLATPTCVAVSAEHNVLFVVDRGRDVVLVFAMSSGTYLGRVWPPVSSVGYVKLMPAPLQLAVDTVRHQLLVTTSYGTGGAIVSVAFPRDDPWRPDAAVHNQFCTPFRHATVALLSAVAAAARRMPAFAAAAAAATGIARLPLELVCLVLELLALETAWGWNCWRFGRRE